MESLASKDTNGKGVFRKSPSAASKALITRNLRLVYGEVASEPLPQNLVDLLNQIDEAEGEQ